MDKRLRDFTLHELLSAYSAPAVAPAGVSGASLAGSVGAALVVKVATITHRRMAPGPLTDRVFMLADKVSRLRHMLEDIVEQDAEAYSRVARLKRTAAGQLAGEEWQRAMKTATIIPGAMGRAAMICINTAAELVDFAYQPALPDLGMGSWLCFSAVEVSLIAVKHNLHQITDEAFIAKINSRLDFFDDRSATLERILATIRRRTDIA